MGFSRQGYWSVEPFPSPGYLPHPGIKSRSPAFEADSSPGKPLTPYLILDKYYYSSICWQEDNGSSKGDGLWIRILPFPLSTCMRLGELLHFLVLFSSLHL